MLSIINAVYQAIKGDLQRPRVEQGNGQWRKELDAERESTRDDWQKCREIIKVAVSFFFSA